MSPYEYAYDGIFAKEFFPTLIHNDLAYFDSAASTQTHMCVLDAMNQYYCEYRSNTHRSNYHIADLATQAVEHARHSVAELIHAESHQVAFNSGATQGLNWIAHWCKHVPVVMVTNMEHNSNLAPWLAQGRSTRDGSLIVLNPHDDYQHIANIFERHCGNAVISMCAASNVTGAHTPYQLWSKMAKERGIRMCLDASQIVSYDPLDLRNLPGITWAVFSAHKMYGPTGVGAVYSKDGFDHLDPLYWGGNNVQYVDFDRGFIPSDGPNKMEAGTLNVAGIIGMGAAAELIEFATHDRILNDQIRLSHYLTMNGIRDFGDLDVIGTGFSDSHKTICFRSIKFDLNDVAELLAQQNIAVRSGRMCSHDQVHNLNQFGVLRVSLAPYNTREDCDRLLSGLNTVLSSLK